MIAAMASVIAVGLDGEAYLTTSDPVEAMVMQAAAERVAEMNDVRDHNLAVSIADQVRQMLGG